MFIAGLIIGIVAGAVAGLCITSCLIVGKQADSIAYWQEEWLKYFNEGNTEKKEENS